MPAGDAQLQTRVVRRYAVAVGDDVDPFALADEVLVPLRVGGIDAVDRGPSASGTGATVPVDLPAAGSGLEVAGAVVSSVVREGDGLVVRVFNPTDGETVVRLPGRRGLAGRPAWAPVRAVRGVVPAAGRRHRHRRAAARLSAGEPVGPTGPARSRVTGESQPAHR